MPPKGRWGTWLLHSLAPHFSGDRSRSFQKACFSWLKGSVLVPISEIPRQHILMKYSVQCYIFIHFMPQTVCMRSYNMEWKYQPHWCWPRNMGWDLRRLKLTRSFKTWCIFRCEQMALVYTILLLSLAEEATNQHWSPNPSWPPKPQLLFEHAGDASRQNPQS